MTDTLLIIGGRLQAIQKARSLGLRVVLLQHKDRLLPGQAEAADALLLVDYLDWDVARPIVRAAHEVYGFTAVVSLVDQAMELVGRINDLLGLGGTSYEVANRFHDKLVMRQWLQASGFETVVAEQVEDAAALREFANRHGYPLVLKPIDGTASRGVVVVAGPDETDTAWRQSSSLRNRADLAMAKFYPVDRLIAEQYLDGPEYSAESFSFDGRHAVLALTDKLTDGVVEAGHAMPAALGPADEAALVEYVSGYLTAMGLRDGVSHVELKLTSRGPRIIEGHDRVAGDRIMDLVEAAYDVDLECYAVGWPHRLVPALPDRPTPLRSAATRFLTAEPGRVVRVEGVDEVRAHPGVLDLDVTVAVGAPVAPVGDNFDRLGQLLVTAEDVSAAVQLCDALVGTVHIVTA